MDGITLNPGSGGKTVDTVELDNGRQVEHVQLATVSEDGIATPISPDNPLPIQLVGGHSAFGFVGKTSIAMADADVVLNAVQASRGLISVTSVTMSQPHFLDFPAEVEDDEDTYSRIVRTLTNDDVIVRCGANQFTISPNVDGVTPVQMILTFEPDQITTINAI